MRRLLLALALVAGVARVAEAHATLVRSVPAAGADLAKSPVRIELVFSEEIEASLARVRIFTTAGSSFVVAVHADPHDVNALIGTLDPLPPGAYWLEWHVVSADGHPVEGRFVFAVGGSVSDIKRPPPVSPPVTGSSEHGPAIPVAAAALRGLAVGALMALAGLLGFRLRAVAPLSEASERRSQYVATLLSIAAALLCTAHLAAWLLTVSPSSSLDSDALQATFGSIVGKLELWRTALAVLACWALLLARRRGIAFVFAAGALLVSGAIGHSAAISPIIATPAKAIHLGAGALWLGGLVWLLTIAGDDFTIIDEARRVSSAALIGVLLVTVSGFVQSFLFLPTPLDLIRTTYGALVIAKFAGVVLLIAFGAQHRFRSLPRLEDDLSATRHFHASLSREVAVMTLVILLGGVLAYVSPATVQ